MKRKDKDVEALWEEVKRLTLEMGRLQQQYDEQTACVIMHRGSEIACSDAMRAAYYDERRRAERLEQALRQIAEWPDGGNRYGQGNIKRFAQDAIDAALLDREEGSRFWPEMPKNGGPDWTGFDG